MASYFGDTVAQFDKDFISEFDHRINTLVLFYNGQCSKVIMVYIIVCNNNYTVCIVSVILGVVISGFDLYMNLLLPPGLISYLYSKCQTSLAPRLANEKVKQ